MFQRIILRGKYIFLPIQKHSRISSQTNNQFQGSRKNSQWFTNTHLFVIQFNNHISILIFDILSRPRKQPVLDFRFSHLYTFLTSANWSSFPKINWLGRWTAIELTRPVGRIISGNSLVFQTVSVRNSQEPAPSRWIDLHDRSGSYPLPESEVAPLL